MLDLLLNITNTSQAMFFNIAKSLDYFLTI